MYWVYILENYTKREFISVTIDLNERLNEHRVEMINAGVNPDKLAVRYKEQFVDAVSALQREKYFKSLSSFKLKKYIERNKILLQKSELIGL